MSEMVERVARGICPKTGCVRAQVGQGLCVHADGRNAPCQATREQLILSHPWAAARAAIAAMREPTDAMKHVLVQAGTVYPLRVWWNGMIDEALK